MKSMRRYVCVHWGLDSFEKVGGERIQRTVSCRLTSPALRRPIVARCALPAIARTPLLASTLANTAAAATQRASRAVAAFHSTPQRAVPAALKFERDAKFSRVTKDDLSFFEKTLGANGMITDPSGIEVILIAFAFPPPLLS
jgi:hypothetical protein